MKNDQVEIKDMEHSITEIANMKLDTQNYEKFENLLSSSLSYIIAYFQKIKIDYDAMIKDLQEWENKKEIQDVLVNGDQYASIPLILYQKKTAVLKCSMDLNSQTMLAVKLLRTARTKYKDSFNVNKSVEVYNEALKEMKDMDTSRFNIFKEQQKDQKEFILEMIKSRDDMMYKIVGDVTKQTDKLNQLMDSIILKVGKQSTPHVIQPTKILKKLPEQTSNVIDINEYQIPTFEQETDIDTTSDTMSFDEKYTGLPPLSKRKGKLKKT